MRYKLGESDRLGVRDRYESKCQRDLHYTVLFMDVTKQSTQYQCHTDLGLADSTLFSTVILGGNLKVDVSA